MEDFLKDIRFGLRTLIKDKTLAIVAVLALAIGTGANTAIFSVINAVLLRPLPYNEPDRLVVMWGTNKLRGALNNPLSVSDFEDYRRENNLFDGIASYTFDDFNLSKGDEPERVQGSMVSANFFSVLGVRMALGNDFASNADQPGAYRVAIIGDGLWKRHFGSRADILDQDILVNGESFKVIGVTPPGFTAIDPADEMWIPISLGASDEARVPSAITPDMIREEPGRRRVSFLLTFGRLKPNVTISQAESDLTSIAQRLESQYQATNRGRSMRIVSLYEQVVGDVKPALIILLAAVGLVLLIACANVANLLLARAAARQKEIAVRLALGATRARLIRQLITEAILLGLAGGALGLVLALGGIKLLLAINPSNIPRLGEINIDLGVLLFTLLISILTGIIFGLVPALQATKPNLNETLKEGGKGTSANAARQRTRNIIVISEVALTQVLLIGAALMLKSFASLQEIEPGFKPQNVLTMRVTLPSLKYSKVDKESGTYEPDSEGIVSFYDRVLKEIHNIPGVEAAGAASVLPLSGDRSELPFKIEGRSQEEPDTANTKVITENYFNALGIPIIQGRIFDDRDRLQSGETNEESSPPLVAIINKSMADKFWPDPANGPLDKRVIVKAMGEDPFKIIGVVGDVKSLKLNDAESQAEIYFTYKQAPTLYMAMVVRARSDAESITGAVREAVRRVDPNQPVFLVKTMDTIVSESISQPRLYMALLTIFASIALVLAGIGIYGVMSYLVTQRRQEIGIRMALGAQASDILKMVVGRGMVLAVIGAVIGLAAAFGLGLIAWRTWPDLMTSLFFGVRSVELTIYLVIPVLLIAVALLSIFIPALRATRVDPMIALRHE